MRYLLTKEADADLENIFDYSISKFGFDQTEKYIIQIHKSLEHLGGFPESGIARPELDKRIRSKISGSHVIFYEEMKAHILVVRILHQSRDVPAFFC